MSFFVLRWSLFVPLLFVGTFSQAQTTINDLIDKWIELRFERCANTQELSETLRQKQFQNLPHLLSKDCKNLTSASTFSDVTIECAKNLDKFLGQYLEKESPLNSLFENCETKDEWKKKVNLSSKPTNAGKPAPPPEEVESAAAVCNVDSSMKAFAKKEEKRVAGGFLCTRNFKCTPKQKFSFGGEKLDAGKYWFRCTAPDGAEPRDPCAKVDLANCVSHSFQEIGLISNGKPVATPSTNVNHGVTTKEVKSGN